MNLQGENAVVEACKQGDRQAFRLLFEEYRERIYRLCFRLTRNANDAEDLAQEVFVRLFERIGSFRGESAFSTWLYRLAWNTGLNVLRRQKPTESLEGWEPADPASIPSPDREITGDQVRAAIDALPDGLRTVFCLVAEEELSYRETAELLHLSVEAIRMRMCRARRLLSAALKDDFKE